MFYKVQCISSSGLLLTNIIISNILIKKATLLRLLLMRYIYFCLMFMGYEATHHEVGRVSS